MKSTIRIRCNSCSRPLEKDEIGVCKKLLGKDIAIFYCLDCLSEFLECDVEEIKAKIEEFKEEGCKLFS